MTSAMPGMSPTLRPKKRGFHFRSQVSVSGRLLFACSLGHLMGPSWFLRDHRYYPQHLIRVSECDILICLLDIIPNHPAGPVLCLHPLQSFSSGNSDPGSPALPTLGPPVYPCRCKALELSAATGNTWRPQVGHHVLRTVSLLTGFLSVN